MRKFIKILALILIFFMLPITTTYAITPDNTEVNAEQDSREQEIRALFSARQQLIFEDTVDVVKLNEIDLQLYELDVEFLSDSEVAERFPDAKAAFDASTDNNDKLASESTIGARGIDLPISNVNTWATYRVANRYYKGQYYNIQQLVASPSEGSASPLWEESAESINVDYAVDWEAGITNFLTSVASIGLSKLAPISMTVFDVFSSVYEGLNPVTELDPNNVIYSWENSTEVVFSYVRLESQNDDYQRLVLISSCCSTEVAFIADVKEYAVNEYGDTVEVPKLLAGVRHIYSTPSTHQAPSRACYAYENWVGGPISDQITSITISGPESKTIVTIIPMQLHFPAGCEP